MNNNGGKVCVKTEKDKDGRIVRTVILFIDTDEYKN